MGCDGGTIPTRDEMVRLKKKPEKKDKDLVRAFKWKHCSITQEPLRAPIVACELGRLYNKESVIEYLLDKSKFEGVTGLDHIKGLKDVKSLQLTDNPAYKAQDGDKGGVYIDRNTAQFICPITGLEMSGQYRFCFIHGCGCVFAERALKEIKTETCNKCGKPYNKEDVILINGTDEDVAQMTEKMEARRMRTKLTKKTKRKLAAERPATAPGSGDSDDGPTTSKQSKLHTTDEPSKLTSGAAKSKLTRGMPASQGASSKLTGGSEKEKKAVCIQEDPRTSKVYKSLFTTSEAAKKQKRAHWVTFNPLYN